MTTNEGGRGRFEGKRALVIGGGEDVARATALRLSAEGADVVIAGLAEDDLAETARRAERDIATHVVDPADEDLLASLADTLGDGDGWLDVLVVYCSDSSVSRLEDMSAAAWEEHVRGNVTGNVLAMKAFLPLLKRAPAGASIVHFTSIDGTLGNTDLAGYSITKGAGNTLVRIAAGEFARYGIRVNGVARCLTAEWVVEHDWDEAAFAPLVAATPLRRIGRADETAAAAAFLASDDASFITGQILTVDGGRTSLTPGVGVMGRPPKR